MTVLSREHVDRVLDQVLDLGKDCSQVEIRLNASKEALSRFSSNEIQQNLAQQDAELGIRLVDDQGRQGMATGNRLDAEGLKTLVATARTVASFQVPETDLLPLVANCPTPEKDSLDEATADWSPEAKAERLRETFDLAREQDLEASGILTSGWSQLALANSAGLRCHYKASTAVFSTTMAGNDVSGWSEGQSSRQDRIDVRALSLEAREIALKAVGAQSLKPGPYTVLLPPAAVADLIMFLNWMGFGAQDYLAGTSALAGKAGEALFSQQLTVTDDAAHPIAEGMPFDYEGVSRKAVTLVDSGVYKGPVHDRTTALQAGTESTGHGFPRPNAHGPFPGNLVVSPGKRGMDELIRNTKRGLLVTHLHYTNVQNPNDLTLTGMTRDGLFWVEDGKVVHPLKNMRFTESLLHAFSSIEEISSEQQLHGGFFGGGFVLPGMKIRDFNFSSESSF